MNLNKNTIYFKNPKPQQIAWLSAAAVTMPAGILLYFLGFKSFYMLFLFATVLFLWCFGVMLYATNFFIFRKIKLIYKSIYDLKSNKFSDDFVGHAERKDPLAKVNQDVSEWSLSKNKEIERLREMENFRKEFLGNVSHELKTPIFNLQMYINTLLDGAIDDKQTAIRFLQKACRSTDRLEAMVQDLLTITQLESGEELLETDIFDIYETIEDVYEALEMKAKEKNITLKYKYGIKAPYMVEAEKKKIRQVIVNLVSNAISYGREGGFVVAGIYDMDSNYLVEITDNGEGVSQQHIERLFERFYRTDKARSRADGGTGLGLAIVKHIIEAHNQTINVRSRLGFGSTFGFTLKRGKMVR